MVNDEETSQDTLKVYHLSYELLGKPYSCVLSKKFNRTYSVQEMIAISFRSTLKTLHEYFVKVFFIPIDLVCDNVVLGTAIVKLDNLIKFTTLKEFLTNYTSNDSTYQSDTTFMMKPTNQVEATESKPHVEVRLLIKYLGTKKLHQTELLENYQKGSEVDVCGGGDTQNKANEFPPTTQVKNNQRDDKDGSEVAISKGGGSNVDILKKPIKHISKQSKSDPSIPWKPERASIQTEKADIDMILSSNNSGKITHLPRLFSYNLQMKSIKLNKKPEKGIWQMSFYHDKADTPRAFLNKEINVDDSEDNAIAFEDIELKLFFTAHADNIMDLIKSSEVCTLSIKGPHGTSAKAQLDCSSLLIGNKENTSGLILLKNQQNDIIAMASIFVYLDDLGINFNMQLKSTESQVMMTPSEYQTDSAKTVDDTKRQLLDESLAYRMIEELEEWKICQHEKFLNELKQKEQSYLLKLKTAWDESRSKQEQVLLEKLDKYSSITTALDAAQRCLKDRGNQYSEDEKEIHKVKVELEKSYNDQLLAIRERARRLEDDMLHELKLKDLKHADIERAKQRLEAENNELKTTIDHLHCKLQEIQSNMIPKQELEHLVQDMVRSMIVNSIYYLLNCLICSFTPNQRMLNDKFETTLQSKMYYKEQWAKALRESHKTKIDSIQRSKENILDSKCNR